MNGSLSNEDVATLTTQDKLEYLFAVVPNLVAKVDTLLDATMDLILDNSAKLRDDWDAYAALLVEQVHNDPENLSVQIKKVADQVASQIADLTRDYGNSRTWIEKLSRRTIDMEGRLERLESFISDLRAAIDALVVERITLDRLDALEGQFKALSDTMIERNQVVDREGTVSTVLAPPKSAPTPPIKTLFSVAEWAGRPEGYWVPRRRGLRAHVGRRLRELLRHHGLDAPMSGSPDNVRMFPPWAFAAYEQYLLTTSNETEPPDLSDWRRWLTQRTVAV